MERSNTRIAYFDLAKGICILMVVWFHVESSPFTATYISPIRMPLYFFLSGFFFKDYQSFAVFIRKKAKHLLVPFAFFYLTTSVLLPIMLHKWGGMDFSTGHDWKLLYAFLTYSEYPNIPLWFLWGLFVLNMVFYVLHRAVRNVWLLGLTCTVLYIALGNGIELPASLHRVFNGILFFFLGHACHRSGFLELPVKAGYKVLLLGLFVALGMVETSHESLHLWVITLMSITGVLLLVWACQSIGHIPYISYVGRYSIMVLVTHEPMIRVLAALHLTNPYMVFLIISVSYVAIIPFMRRYLPYVTAQK